MSDGGEGLLDVLGGANRTTIVTGPLGRPVEAAWRLDHRTAVIEMAQASGLALAGGAEGNDPLAASTAGTGELIARAVDQGARRVIVGLGGSATTDGGLGAVEALRSPARLRTVELEVACDVRTRFVDAAAVFAPQKGASPAQVALLTARLEQLAARYRDAVRRRRDRARRRRRRRVGSPAASPRSAAGSSAASSSSPSTSTSRSGSRAADVVVTGEGHLDAQSLDGKVVGGVCDLAARRRPAGRRDRRRRRRRRRRRACAHGRTSPSSRWSSASASTARSAEPRWCIEHAAADALGTDALRMR